MKRGVHFLPQCGKNDYLRENNGQLIYMNINVRINLPWSCVFDTLIYLFKLSKSVGSQIPKLMDLIFYSNTFTKSATFL